MSAPKFVAELPDSNPGGGPSRRTEFDRLREELAQHPGQWAEIQREPRLRADNARQRAKYLKKRGLDTTTRMVGDECLVFARVAAQP